MVSIFSKFSALRRRVLVRTPFCLAANQSEARGIKLKGRENFAAHGWVFNNGPVCPDCRKVGGTESGADGNQAAAATSSLFHIQS